MSGLFDTSTAAHLAGSLALALFFRLLIRHDPRPYLRSWTWAWAAQALALAALLAASLTGLGLLLHVFALGQMAYGLLALSAAWSFARGSLSPAAHRTGVVLLGLWSLTVPRLLSDVPSLLAAHWGVMSAVHVGATALLWRLREPSGIGLRATTDALAVLALQHAAALGWWLVRGHDATALAANPLVTSLLQTILGLGIALAVMEAAQWAVTATHEQLREAQHRLKILGETDALTGCFNRQVFRELVDDLRSSGRGERGIVLLVDLDGFRALNQREGHSAGDEALRRAAEAIRSRSRPTDILVRWGADEFALVLQGVASGEAEARRTEIAEALVRSGLAASAGTGAYGPAADIMAAVETAAGALDAARSRSAKT